MPSTIAMHQSGQGDGRQVSVRSPRVGVFRLDPDSETFASFRDRWCVKMTIVCAVGGRVLVVECEDSVSGAAIFSEFPEDQLVNNLTLVPAALFCSPTGFTQRMPGLGRFLAIRAVCRMSTTSLAGDARSPVRVGAARGCPHWTTPRCPASFFLGAGFPGPTCVRWRRNAGSTP